MPKAIYCHQQTTIRHNVHLMTLVNYQQVQQIVCRAQTTQQQLKNRVAKQQQMFHHVLNQVTKLMH
jgi:hypothetical protein